MTRYFLAPALVVGLASAAVARAETLDFSWPQNVGPLNPHLYSPNQMFAQAMVYEGLVTYMPDGTVAPALATGWAVSDDGRTFTFTLREGVRFSDGEPFDAAAVERNFAAILGNGARHKWLGLMGALDTVRATGPMTVEITTKEPYYPLLQELSLIRPVRFLAPDAFPDSGQTAEGIKAPIGTGPWVLSESRLGEYDVFTRNETYWGPKPAFDRIVVKVIADPNTRAIALETGEIDLIYGVEGQITPDTFQRLRDQGFESGTSDPLETMVFALNTAKGPTADLAVRKAINHALNKDAMVTGIFYGTQTRADTLFAPSVPYADIGLTPYGYDPAKARHLLDAAGWVLPEGGTVRVRDGLPLQIDLVYEASDAVMKSVAEVAQADLAAVGIGVSLLASEETEFHGRQQSGNFSMIFNNTWGNPYDPHAFVSSMRVPSHADYQAQLGLNEKPAIDAAIARVLVSTDETLRQAEYDYILRTLHEEAVYVPLTHATAIGVAGPDVTGLSFGATSNEIPFGTLRPAK